MACGEHAIGVAVAAIARQADFGLDPLVGLLLSSGAMFLVDLIYRDDAPKNIPFTPFTVFAQPGKLGFSIEF